jgi:hypothetical protein
VIHEKHINICSSERKSLCVKQASQCLPYSPYKMFKLRDHHKNHFSAITKQGNNKNHDPMLNTACQNHTTSTRILSLPSKPKYQDSFTHQNQTKHTSSLTLTSHRLPPSRPRLPLRRRRRLMPHRCALVSGTIRERGRTSLDRVGEACGYS